MSKQAFETKEYAKRAQEYAEEKLGGTLLEHVLGCADTAEKLARKFGCDEDKAAAACYLHDVAKPMPHDSRVARARELGMTPAKIQSYLPPVLHGPVAALIANKELGIDDPEILEAVEFHSTGRAGMGKLGKVIFVADFIEFTRVFPGAAELRSHGALTLDELAMAILRRKLEHLLRENRPIDRHAIEFWNDLTKKTQ
ncbi:MAG: HD domain-containing protein [Candidatus Abyssobacteria bacterium SURF_5]|uniref:bis(5'-nucleosyl)-tetraphosphatase (symmetrical) n=1 Tax=Abyssobacteria bacterium (strain SURF_5) TaxID=2093360 RepID=A0A3A4N1U6_ABYX5|nr:MAG: HD domain-containing protein [Candidatus Abyssubacteria bacterium SURF_5]